MILKAFSVYIQRHKNDILTSKTTATKLLCRWIKHVINKNPKNHVDKIVHKEIMLAENKAGDFLIVGKSESGRILVNALYNYALSYEHFILSKRLDDKLPDGFTK